MTKLIIDGTEIDVPAEFIRLPTVKAAHFQTHHTMCESECDHVIGNVGRILLMMAKGTNRVFGCGRSMRVSSWTNGRIPFRRHIERQQIVFP